MLCWTRELWCLQSAKPAASHHISLFPTASASKAGHHTVPALLLLIVLEFSIAVLNQRAMVPPICQTPRISPCQPLAYTGSVSKAGLLTFAAWLLLMVQEFSVALEPPSRYMVPPICQTPSILPCQPLHSICFQSRPSYLLRPRVANRAGVQRCAGTIVEIHCASFLPNPQNLAMSAPCLHSICFQSRPSHPPSNAVADRAGVERCAGTTVEKRDSSILPSPQNFAMSAPCLHRICFQSRPSYQCSLAVADGAGVQRCAGTTVEQHGASKLPTPQNLAKSAPCLHRICFQSRPSYRCSNAVADGAGVEGCTGTSPERHGASKLPNTAQFESTCPQPS